MEFFTDRNCGRDFPLRLRAAGVTVHLHDDHFEPDAEDEEWAPIVAERGWIALSRDRRITRTALEYDAVMFAGGRLFVLTGGSMKTDLLAQSFLNTLPRVIEFVEAHAAPFIATIDRPSPVESIVSGAPGSLKMRMDVADWERRRRRRFPND